MLSIHGIACAVWDSGGTLGGPVWYISYPGEYTPGCPGSLQELLASQWPKIQPKFLLPDTQDNLNDFFTRTEYFLNVDQDKSPDNFWLSSFSGQAASKNYRSKPEFLLRLETEFQDTPKQHIYSFFKDWLKY